MYQVGSGGGKEAARCLTVVEVFIPFRDWGKQKENCWIKFRRGWGQRQNDRSTACWSHLHLWQAGAASAHKQLISPCIRHNQTSIWKKRGSWGLPLCLPTMGFVWKTENYDSVSLPPDNNETLAPLAFKVSKENRKMLVTPGSLMESIFGVFLSRGCDWCNTGC